MSTPLNMNIDFAALRTLKLVHEHRSFTDTANILDVNQSAVSYTIEKLRKIFEDPLFYRQGGTIVPTERCNIIVDSAAAILEQFEVLTQPDEFDPATADATIAIACNYYERSVVLPHVISKLRAQAPGVRLSLLNSTDSGDIKLKRSDADLLIGPLRPDEQDFYCRKLLQDNYVCIMDPTNPLAKESMTIEDYVRCPHVTISYGGSWRSLYLIELAKLGLELNEVVAVPSAACLDHTIRGTDLVATVPSRIAATYPGHLHIVDCPIQAPFEVDLVWTTRTHSSPMHMWLRELIFGSVKGGVTKTA